MRRSLLYSAGEMKRHRWYRNTGMLRNSAVMSVSLSGVMNGEVTLVAIMLEPTGSRRSMGVATKSNTRFWNGNSAKKIASKDATHQSRRRRISSRWPIAELLSRDSGGGGLDAVLTARGAEDRRRVGAA